MKLAKEGYYGGNPEKVLKAPVDVILNVLKYEATEKEYFEKYRQMNEVQ